MQRLQRHVHTRSQTRGFSLIELLVVFAIIIMLVALTLQYFGNYARVQQYQRTVEEVGRTLELARQQTVASKEDAVYGVYIGTTTVELFEGLTPTPGSAANTIIDLSQVPVTATSSLSTGQWYFVFERVTGEASATGTITVSSAALGRTATFTVFTSGLVQ